MNARRSAGRAVLTHVLNLVKGIVLTGTLLAVIAAGNARAAGDTAALSGRVASSEASR